jgi:hypothetical protein
MIGRRRAMILAATLVTACGPERTYDERGVGTAVSRDGEGRYRIVAKSPFYFGQWSPEGALSMVWPPALQAAARAARKDGVEAFRMRSVQAERPALRNPRTGDPGPPMMILTMVVELERAGATSSARGPRYETAAVLAGRPFPPPLRRPQREVVDELVADFDGN